jgi:hypothetical protein
LSPEKAYYSGQQDIPQKIARGKPTVLKNRKATVPDTGWRVVGTPPESKSGACIQRGNSGTWESQCVSLGKTRSRRATHLAYHPSSSSGDPIQKRPGGIHRKRCST